MIDILMPLGRGHLVMLRAYFDTSTRFEGAGGAPSIFCVAGFAFDQERAYAAEREWLALMGGTIAHIADMHGRRGAFKGWSDEKCDLTIREQVRIIQTHASFGVSVSCDLRELAGMLLSEAEPNSVRLLDGFKLPYAVCGHFAMQMMGGLIEASGSKDRAAYLFELGDEGHGDLENFANYAMQKGPMRKVYQCHSYGYAEKGSERLLETADLLAWEWAKYVDLFFAERKPARPSLSALLGDELKGIHFHSPKFEAIHLRAPELSQFFETIGAVLTTTDGDELVSILCESLSEIHRMEQALVDMR